MRGLYAIVDLGTLATRKLDPLGFARALLDAGVRTLQLRDKSSDSARALSLLESLVRLAEPASAAVYANDRVDLALLAGARGVHVGQSDLPPVRVAELARRAGAPLEIGRSTHDEAQLRAACDEPIDYVAVGPVAATSSKADHDPVLGLEQARRLGRLAAQLRPGLPRVAIGGIDPERASWLAGDFDAIAVIGGLMPAPGEPLGAASERAALYVEALGRGPGA